VAKILVTGAAGFIGSNLVDALLAQDHEVYGLDNFLTGSPKNISHLLNNQKFIFYKADINKGLGDWESIQFDDIYHLASPASPPKYLKYPLETMWANTNATEYLLNYCKRNGSRLLFSSTSEVYGDPLEHPQTESYWGNVNPIGPRSVYDEAKRYGETLLSLYQKNNWADCVIVRIFNTYGERLDPEDGRVVSSFLRDGINGNPIQIYGDGKQTRSFCYVSDTVRALIATMESGIKGPINLGNPNEFTLLELLNNVEQVLGIKAELEFMPLPQDDPKKRQPNIQYANKVLGWKPEVELLEGLTRTAEWMKVFLQK
jgi:nucleoside-diphosphate-sugar epimerase